MDLEVLYQPKVSYLHDAGSAGKNSLTVQEHAFFFNTLHYNANAQVTILCELATSFDTFRA